MYYCENCHLVCEGPVCPYCGSTSLRAPKGGDFCYLSTMVSPWGEAMQELLKEAGIRRTGSGGSSAACSACRAQRWWRKSAACCWQTGLRSGM